MSRPAPSNLFRKLFAKPECLETDDVSHPDPRLIIAVLALGMIVGAAFTSTGSVNASTSLAQEKSATVQAADVSR
ncbi:MAG TPA: hypothetical protein VG711_07565 [Phycisphaerales bacterium]|nr:hypothetical protein [Phycisphaerales bacterium]